MRRGDVVWADLEPSRGSEANKVRPVVIVSSDAVGKRVERLGRGILACVPLTSNVTHVREFQVLLSSEECRLPRDSKAQAEQIRAIDASRVGSRIGHLPPQVMRKVDDAIRFHLGL